MFSACVAAVSQAAWAPWIDGAGKNLMGAASIQQRNAKWLGENGPRELELLLRAVLYHSSQPILIADNDRHCLDASFGASKLLKLSRDQIIARTIDELVAPDFQPRMADLWQAFLEKARARRHGTALVGRWAHPGGRVSGTGQRAARAASVRLAPGDRTEGSRGACLGGGPRPVLGEGLRPAFVGRRWPDCRLVFGR